MGTFYQTVVGWRIRLKATARVQILPCHAFFSKITLPGYGFNKFSKMR